MLKLPKTFPNPEQAARNLNAALNKARSQPATPVWVCDLCYALTPDREEICRDCKTRQSVPDEE